MTASYEALGVPAMINAAGRYTALGGSLMPPEILDAMRAAASTHVDMVELHRRVGARLAELTGNEAADVTCGAAAGIALAVLGCRSGTDEAEAIRIAEGRARPAEVIVLRAQRVPYIPAVRLAGADIVEAGSVGGCTAADLEAAVTEHTVAVLYVARPDLARGVLDLPAAVAVARRHRLRVIVDAAAQLPPRENLWRFTRDEGADVALFSGGKELCGPQASGLVVGRRELIDAMALHAAPLQRLGRAMKVGKEEIMGLLAAVERYLSLDLDEQAAAWEAVLAGWSAGLGELAGLAVRRDEVNEAGQPIPRLVVRLDGGVTADAMFARLRSGRPQVAVALVGPQEFGVTPETVTEDEAAQLVPAIRAALAELCA